MGDGGGWRIDAPAERHVLRFCVSGARRIGSFAHTKGRRFLGAAPLLYRGVVSAARSLAAR